LNACTGAKAAVAAAKAASAEMVGGTGAIDVRLLAIIELRLSFPVCTKVERRAVFCAAALTAVDLTDAGTGRALLTFSAEAEAEAGAEAIL
jgi:hypothetical protein